MNQPLSALQIANLKAAITSIREQRIDLNDLSPEEKRRRSKRKAAITRRLKRQVCEEFGLEGLPTKGRRSLFAGAQGSGKSRTTAEGLIEFARDVAVHFLVPTLERAEEQAADLRAMGADAFVVRGRGAPVARGAEEMMCARHEVVNRAATMGVDVQKDICKVCPHKDNCAFQDQREALDGRTAGVFVMSHEYIWLPSHAPKADMIVVDESIIGAAAAEVSFDPSRITEDSKWNIHGELDPVLELRRIASRMKQAITDHPGRELDYLREHNVTVADLRGNLKHLTSREDAVPEVSGAMSDAEIAAQLDAVEATEVRKVESLFRAVRDEIEQPRPGLNAVWFEPDCRVMLNGKPERQPRVFVAHVRRLTRVRSTTPILLLDGTGSLDLNRAVFGAHVEEMRFQPPRDAEVVQVTGKAFSKQSLLGHGTNGKPVSAGHGASAARLRQHVIDLLRLLPGVVLLVAAKPVVELMTPDLPENVVTAHFGALRGLNGFEHCETVVVVGREQPSPAEIERIARAFTARDAAPFRTVTGDPDNPLGYAPQCRGRTLRDDLAANVAVVPVHPDPRAQAILEQTREAEIVQAVDRVRCIYNHRRVIILGDLALNVTVDRLVPWREAKPSPLALAFARHGVLPLAKCELHNAFPDLFSTVKVADSALFRQKKASESKLVSFWGLRPFSQSKPPIDGRVHEAAGARLCSALTCPTLGPLSRLWWGLCPSSP